jgi:hypothetical protein
VTSRSSDRQRDTSVHGAGTFALIELKKPHGLNRGQVKAQQASNTYSAKLISLSPVWLTTKVKASLKDKGWRS